VTTMRSHILTRRRGRVRAAAGCGLFLLLLPWSVLPSYGARWRLDSNPVPPSAAEIGVAAGQVSRHQAALGAEQRKLSAADLELAALRDQSETLTERYDQTMVNEQRAQSAYQITEARLADAERAESLSQQRVDDLATEEYESGGGFGSAVDMLGAAQGPQAYLRQLGIGQMLAEYGTDALAENQADDGIATVFRTQAHDLLIARQADLRAAGDLRQAVESAIARQAEFVRADKGAAHALSAQLAAAAAHEAALQAARQAALAAAAAQQAAAASRDTAAADQPSTAVQAPSWAYGSGASATQGDIAANWALSQLGKPYLWGGAGPEAYDCSGLTMEAWAHAGVPLLHWTGYQWGEGPHVPVTGLQRGDLLFYATNTADPSTIHHVGIYIGNGMMVDAPYTGAFVRIDSIYAPGGLIGAVRPAG
jgi:peptidoglycan DL-endopeptidase RipA